MLLDLIARYFKYLWIAFAALAFLKIILSYSFNDNLEGFNGIVYSLFKWYGEEEQELEEERARRTIMRLYNILTLLLYAMLLIILVAWLLSKFIRS